jgi:hypothetical protein
MKNGSEYDWREVLNYIVHCGICPSNSSLAVKFSLVGHFAFGSHFTFIPTVRYEKLSSLLPATKDKEPLTLSEVSFIFGRQATNPYSFPQIDFDLSLLFNTLSISNILSIFECVLGILFFLFNPFYRFLF